MRCYSQRWSINLLAVARSASACSSIPLPFSANESSSIDRVIGHDRLFRLMCLILLAFIQMSHSASCSPCKRKHAIQFHFSLFFNI